MQSSPSIPSLNFEHILIFLSLAKTEEAKQGISNSLAPELASHATDISELAFDISKRKAGEKHPGILFLEQHAKTAEGRLELRTLVDELQSHTAFTHLFNSRVKLLQALHCDTPDPLRSSAEHLTTLSAQVIYDLCMDVAMQDYGDTISDWFIRAMRDLFIFNGGGNLSDNEKVIDKLWCTGVGFSAIAELNLAPFEPTPWLCKVLTEHCSADTAAKFLIAVNPCKLSPKVKSSDHLIHFFYPDTSNFQSVYIQSYAEQLVKTDSPEMSSCLATLYSKHKTSPVSSQLTYQEPNTIEGYLDSVNSKNSKRLRREIGDTNGHQEGNNNSTENGNGRQVRSKNGITVTP